MSSAAWSTRVAEAERLMAAGDVARVATLMSAAAADPAAPVAALRLSARSLRALERHQAAAAPLRRLVDLQPRSAVAEHNLAAALGDAGDGQASHDAARRALAKGGDAPETWLVLARALMSLSRLDESERAFRESLTRRPLAPEILRDLAQLIWMRDGDAGAALSVIDAALASGGSEDLAAMRGCVARDIVGDREAYAGMEPFLGRSTRPVLALAAYAAALEFDPAKALEHARQALGVAPQDPGCRSALCAGLLATGQTVEALSELEAFIRQWPLDQYGLALRLVAWRVLDDPRALGPEDYHRLVSVMDLQTPAGMDRDLWLAQAGAGLRGLHPFQAEPLGQSIRAGVQAALDPRFSADPAVEAVFAALPAPIETYIAGLSGQDDPMSLRVGSGYEIFGAWSVRLKAGGHHSDHIHPKGWISSALYIEVPEPSPEQPKAGWLRFGACRLGVGLDLPPQHWIEPSPGRVALFPSWMWHGTEPFSGGGERLTVAFDVQPR